MRQYDVFENPEDDTRGFAPYLVILSSHLVDLNLVVFAPLFTDRTLGAGTIEIELTVDRATYWLSLTDLASVSPGRLKRQVANIADHEDAIRRGLDRLFTGF